MRIDPRHGRRRARAVRRGDRRRSVPGLADEAQLTLEDYARLPGPARHAALDVAAQGHVAAALADAGRRRRRAHPRHRHARGDRVPARPHADERQAGRLLRRDAHRVGAGLGRARQPAGGGAHGRAPRRARPRRAGRRGRRRPRRRRRPPSGTRRAWPRSAARTVRWATVERDRVGVPPARPSAGARRWPAQRLVAEVDLHTMAARRRRRAHARVARPRRARPRDRGDRLRQRPAGGGARTARRPRGPRAGACSCPAARRAASCPPTATRAAAACCATWA